MIGNISTVVMCYVLPIGFIAWVIWKFLKDSPLTKSPARPGYTIKHVYGAEELINAACVLDRRRTTQRDRPLIVAHVNPVERGDWHVNNHIREIERIGADYGVFWVEDNE